MTNNNYQSPVSNQESTALQSQSPKRPLGVTLLTWMVLIITLLSWLQFGEVLYRWDFLQSLTPALPVLYLAITGLVWGLLGACLVWGLFLGRSWAFRLIQICAPVYAAFYWFDRLLIADPSAIANRWPFALGLTIILLAFTFWILSRPKTKIFFKITNLTDFDI